MWFITKDELWTDWLWSYSCCFCWCCHSSSKLQHFNDRLPCALLHCNANARVLCSLAVSSLIYLILLSILVVMTEILPSISSYHMLNTFHDQKKSVTALLWLKVTSMIISKWVQLRVYFRLFKLIQPCTNWFLVLTCHYTAVTPKLFDTWLSIKYIC